MENTCNFIRLTCLDGRAIYLNAAYVTTIEPMRSGSGTLVVPLGEDIDYEVRESAETVIALCRGVPPPPPAPKPVPESKPAPEAKPVPKSEPVPETKPADAAEAVPAPVISVTTAPAAVETPPAETPPAETAAAKPAAPAKRRGGRRMVLTLNEEQCMRLRRMAPSSTRKLTNTLMAQFHVKKVEHEIKALVSNGIIAITGQDHVDWLGALPS